MNELGERLKELRENKGWSKTLVAEKLGLKNMPTYANWEYGTRLPDAGRLKELANLYGVTTDYLLGNNQTPEWATEKDTNDLESFLKQNEGSMTYGGEHLTDEEKEKLEIAMTQIFWNRHKHN